jgi:1,2-diacylglycerol 3-beta-glucosyltransferase
MSEKNLENELNPIESLLSEWSDPEAEEEEFRRDFFQGLSGRRQKAAVVLATVWGMAIALHELSWGVYLVWVLIGFLAIYALRLMLAKPESNPDPLTDDALAIAPTVSLLVAAKNEEAVISKLVKMLCNLDYPVDKYEVWVINDYSTDQTPILLDQLAQEYDQLKVLHRSAGAGGGKSGALNQVLPLTKGEIIVVFDADAQVSPDLLRNIIPLFDSPNMGAVQVRKSIVNDQINFWTRGQAIEMIMDGYFQQQRIATNGIGELRGNGQFVRRTALERCGGWNEETITDDLDLTIRLHLDGWKIGFLMFPFVGEEGVTRLVSLWHQRNRWAEGGYQRYLDYWRLIFKHPMGWDKKVDLVAFLFLQYLLPTAAIPDLIMAIARHHFPLLTPVTFVTFTLSFGGMLVGLNRLQPNQKFSFTDLMAMIGRSLLGIVYFAHWFVIIPFNTFKMSIRPKRLKWVKTVHEGTHQEGFVS